MAHLWLRLRPGRLNRVDLLWIERGRANNGSGRRPTELEKLVTAALKVSEPSATLPGHCHILIVVSKLDFHFRIIARTWAANDVADAEGNVEDVPQIQGAVSFGARALWEQLDGDVDDANAENFHRARRHVGSRRGRERHVRGKPTTVMSNTRREGSV